MPTLDASASPRFKPLLMQTVARRVLLEWLSRQPSGSRLPPIRELARELGVGQSSLYGAMRELGREGVVYSKPKLGSFLAREVAPAEERDETRPSVASPTGGLPAAKLAGKRIAQVLAPHADELFLTMARAAAAALSSMGAVTHEQELATNELTFEPGAAPDVSILFNPNSTIAAPAPGDPPRVVVSTSWRPGMMPLNCDLIGVDQEGGPYLAGRLFRKLGMTRACFIGRSTVRDTPRFDPLSAIRLRGFESGLGAEVSEKHRIDSGGYSLTGGGRALTRYLAVRDRPKAIFAASDDIAIGFLVAAASHQLEAGRDFHLIGFDGHGMGRRIPEGPLTTVEVPAQAMGRAAAEAAANRLLQPDRPLQATTLACHLFLGRTVAGADAISE